MQINHKSSDKRDWLRKLPQIINQTGRTIDICFKELMLSRDIKQYLSEPTRAIGHDFEIFRFICFNKAETLSRVAALRYIEIYDLGFGHCETGWDISIIWKILSTCSRVRTFGSSHNLIRLDSKPLSRSNEKLTEAINRSAQTDSQRPLTTQLAVKQFFILLSPTWFLFKAFDFNFIQFSVPCKFWYVHRIAFPASKAINFYYEQ